MKKISSYFIVVFIFFLFALFAQQVSAQSDVERVIIISIDSMNNNFIFNEYENSDFILTPNIGTLVKNGAAFTDAEAVMPTLTQVNHVTMVCGCYAEKIGIAGNYVLDREKGSNLFWENYLYPWKRPELITADTIFKVLEREDSNYTSAVVAGKNYVGCPIWADIQVGPACTSESAKELGIKKFPEVQLWDSPDEWVMDNAILVLEKVDPNIMLVNLAFLDPVQHAFSHSSAESWAAVSWADYQVGRLIKYLKDSAKLTGTLIILTADHGQSNEWEEIDVGKLLKNNGIKSRLLSEGPFAHIFLDSQDDLEKAVSVLEDLDALDGIWYRESLDDIHIETPYTGDIVVSLRPPYETFYPMKSAHIGTHGGLQQRFVPLIFFGPYIKKGLILRNASLTDIVPTISEITGFPLPEDSQGKVLPVIDYSQNTAPTIDYKFETFKVHRLSYIAVLFFFVSILTLFTALYLQKNYRLLWFDIPTKRIWGIAPSLLMIISLVFALSSAFYTHIANLYAIPGIQPDAFLVSSDFGILGSFIVSLPIAFLIILFIPWIIQLLFLIILFIPWVVQLLFFKIRKKETWIIKSVPLYFTFLVISQLIYASINMIVRIPYHYTFGLFMTFFFGGLGLSYLFRLLMIKRTIKVGRRKSLAWTIVLGVLNAIFWFYIIMFVLFPHYLFEYGITSIF